MTSTECRWRQVCQRPTCLNPQGARWQCQSVPTLTTWLEQGPVRDDGPTTHWSFSIACRLPSPDWAPGLHHMSTLQRRWRDGRTPAQLTTRSRGTSGQEENSKWTLDAYGTYSDGSGLWPAPLPPTGNERERERENWEKITQVTLMFLYVSAMTTRRNSGFLRWSMKLE